MNKTTKGALAASAAAVLLMGGVGTLAYWNDDAVVNGGSVNSGYLEINPTVVSPNTAPCDSVWKHTNGPKNGTTVVNIVPGDVITKNCTFVVKAKGDNLEAIPTVPATIAYTAASTAPGNPAVTTLSLPVAATYTLGSTALTGNITEADDTKILTAKIQVSFPFGSTTVNSNDTQNVLTTLSSLTVQLTQKNNGA